MMVSHQVEELAAEAGVQVKRRFSIVWIVPLVALLIGGWLAFKAISEKGPTITITFSNAEGMEAGKTKIKYKDVEVGQVEKIELSQSISHVIVTAKLVKGGEQYLTDKTKFWVVRARVHGGSVSGLTTLLSGAYIGVDPCQDGKPTRTFKGLDAQPVVTLGQPGRHFRLNADALGSLDIGAPVYYRQIQVGQVVGYKLGQGGRGVDIQIFIEAPHHKQVKENTRFWNASGIDVTLNAQGLKVDVQSLISVISGGIAFDQPKDSPPGDEAKDEAAFHLYQDRASTNEKSFSIRNYYLMLFNQSVRGLYIGAPVELYGIKVGEVIDLNLEFDVTNKQFLVPVLIAVEPERIRVVNQKDGNGDMRKTPYVFLKEMVEQRGLRAQLQNGNLLTGQLMVNLDFYPDLPKKTLYFKGKYPVVPTIPGTFQQLQESVVKLIGNLEKVPFREIGAEVRLVLQETQNTLKQIRGLAEKLTQDTAPQAKATLMDLQKVLLEMQKTLNQDSPLNYNAKKTLEELTRTLRTVRELAETLDKRPQSIIFGKEKEKHE
ncbi:MAG: MCE family protein [Deltaproteobacteria bacterium]|nr:MCE family protein [Deltaproteobacteria bacterium]